MISLIKNELTKIFKKKSFYIVMILTFIFIIVMNIILKNLANDDGMQYSIDYGAEAEFYEEQLQELDPNNESEQEIYIEYKTALEQMKLFEKYGGMSSWKYTIINNQVRPILFELVSHEVKNDTNSDVYKENIERYNTLIERFDKDDWRSFAQEELDDVNTQLEERNKLKDDITDKISLSNIEYEIFDLTLQKQVLEWRLEKDISYKMSDKNTLLNQYYTNSLDVRNYEDSNNQDDFFAKEQYRSSLELLNEAKYDIENDTTITNTTDARGILLDFFSQYEIFIIIIIVMIAGTIVSEEFNKGTVKLLLVRPYKRTTILTSKFITCIIMLIVTIVLIMTMQFVVGGIVQGFESLNTPAVVYNFDTNQMEEIPIFTYMLLQTLGKLPIYILLMTLAFALSTLFNNSAVAITLTLLGYMGSPMINQLGLYYNLDWIRFFVTPNWDLTQYLYGGIAQFEGLTPLFSIIICLVYFIIMLIPTYIVFKKRNIKNI